jgi:predicted metal-dependent phosphoesterase TrpH
MPQRFVDFLRGRARSRADRYDGAATRLGLPIADAEARAGHRALTRHHLARALVEHKQVGSIQAAFQGPLARRKGLVPPIELTVADALQEMSDCGAISVWAHPRIDHATEFLGHFAKLGLNGVEAYRPSASLTQRAALARMALTHGMVVTGGSDWHGWRGRLGSFRVRASEVAPFLHQLDGPTSVGQNSGTCLVDPPGRKTVHPS